MWSKYAYKKGEKSIPALIKCPVCHFDGFVKKYEYLIGSEPEDDNSEILYCGNCHFKLTFGNKYMITEVKSDTF